MLAANPDFGKALVGAWYETMALMSGGDDGRGRGARPRWPRPRAPISPATTRSSPRPRCSTSPPSRGRLRAEPGAVSDHGPASRKFSDRHGHARQGAPRRFVGIAFPDGETLGDPDNVKLRFDDSYMQMAADGAL